MSFLHKCIRPKVARTSRKSSANTPNTFLRTANKKRFRLYENKKKRETRHQSYAELNFQQEVSHIARGTTCNLPALREQLKLFPGVQKESISLHRV